MCLEGVLPRLGQQPGNGLSQEPRPEASRRLRDIPGGDTHAGVGHWPLPLLHGSRGPRSVPIRGRRGSLGGSNRCEQDQDIPRQVLKLPEQETNHDTDKRSES